MDSIYKEGKAIDKIDAEEKKKMKKPSYSSNTTKLKQAT